MSQLIETLPSLRPAKACYDYFVDSLIKSGHFQAVQLLEPHQRTAALLERQKHLQKYVHASWHDLMIQHIFILYLRSLSISSDLFEYSTIIERFIGTYSTIRASKKKREQHRSNSTSKIEGGMNLPSSSPLERQYSLTADNVDAADSAEPDNETKAGDVHADISRIVIKAEKFKECLKPVSKGSERLA